MDDVNDFRITDLVYILAEGKNLDGSKSHLYWHSRKYTGNWNYATIRYKYSVNDIIWEHTDTKVILWRPSRNFPAFQLLEL